MSKGQGSKTISYKISFFLGQLIFYLMLIILGIFIISAVFSFLLSGKISTSYTFILNELTKYWFNPNWLNENQGILSMLQIILSILPIVLYIFSFKFFRDWRKEYNTKIKDISTSTLTVAMSLFRIRIDLKKYIQHYKNENIYCVIKLFRSYPLAYCINKKFESKDAQIDDAKLYLLTILEYIDMTNDLQKHLLSDLKNIHLQKQIVINMEFLLDKINETLPVLQKLIQKYEYQIKDWKFCTDPTFLKSFTKEELYCEII